MTERKSRRNTILGRIMTTLLYYERPWITREVSPDGLWLRVRVATGHMTLACHMRGNGKIIDYFRQLEALDLVSGLSYDGHGRRLEIYVPMPRATAGDHPIEWDRTPRSRRVAEIQHGNTPPPVCGFEATEMPYGASQHQPRPQDPGRTRKRPKGRARAPGDQEG